MLEGMKPTPFTLREQVKPSDRQTVRAILESSGFFYPAEVAVAVELVEERLAKGEASGYFFLFAEGPQGTAGYACFGPIACTQASYDLYWIGVRQDHRHRGLGRLLLAASEEAIRKRGGRRVYVETSSRQQYEPTRQFYLRCGYRVEAVLQEFYGPGDGKVVFVKILD
jgi:GNAT superfamily N-acetyltransferase